MDIPSLYQSYVEAGQQPCRCNDPLRGAKIHAYQAAKQKLFEALKISHLNGELPSTRAAGLIQVISESTQNPEGFWGSLKVATVNQAIFVHEKNERLFEELLRCWRDRYE